MHSPLPDASALEAGILEDETPSRLSRVQDNVRNLLRTSRFGSVHSSPLASPTHQPHLDHGLSTPPDSPTRRTQHQQPEVLPSPSAESSTSTSTTSTPPPQTGEVRGVLFPPASYQRAVQQMAHQSALFNTRAVAALNHPDLSDPTLAVYVQQHKAEGRQRRAWTRSRHGRKRHVAASAGSSQCLLCVLAALLLSAIIATCMSMNPFEWRFLNRWLIQMQTSFSPQAQAKSHRLSMSCSSSASYWQQSSLRTRYSESFSSPTTLEDLCEESSSCRLRERNIVAIGENITNITNHA